MVSHLSLGIEEEFQLVDQATGQLASRVHTILDKGAPLLGDKIKPEMLQSVIEAITAVCPDIVTLRAELKGLVETVAQLVETEGLALISAGTHPMALWQDQVRTNNERYAELEEEYQDVGRSILIFAVHVHVGIESREIAIPLMNQLRTWMPHLLALSSNSPFWNGRLSGLKSYRAIVWRRFPRSGLPSVFTSTREFDDYVESLIRTGCIDNGKRIWWDIRLHPFFNTLEFRICDMLPTMEDTLAIAALCQALVAKLTWLYHHNLTTHILPGHFIEENKWRAARYGLDAQIVDFIHNRTMSMREAISDLLDFVDDVVDDLNSRCEITHLRSLLADPQGTGADRQIAIYKATGSPLAVTRFLMQQTMKGLASSSVSQVPAG
jgi:carboxylate-amine ligase